MVCAYHINAGLIANFNKNSQFPLNDCTSRRILMWNEPNIQQSSYDTVKAITAGDPTSVAIKYQPNGYLNRTPIIFLSNNKLFSETELWTSRIYFENWKVSPFLRDCTRYPHPLTYYNLVREYVNDI